MSVISIIISININKLPVPSFLLQVNQNESWFFLWWRQNISITRMIIPIILLNRQNTERPDRCWYIEITFDQSLCCKFHTDSTMRWCWQGLMLPKASLMFDRYSQGKVMQCYCVRSLWGGQISCWELLLCCSSRNKGVVPCWQWLSCFCLTLVSY